MTFYYSPQEEQRIWEISARVQSELGEWAFEEDSVSTYFNYLKPGENLFRSRKLLALPMRTVFWSDLLRMCEEHQWSYERATLSEDFFKNTEYARKEVLKEVDEDLQLRQSAFDSLKADKDQSLLSTLIQEGLLGSFVQMATSTRFIPMYRLARKNQTVYLMRSERFVRDASKNIVDVSRIEALATKKKTLLEIDALAFYGFEPSFVRADTHRFLA